ncbi:uncharacterized protein LOC111402757 isoform X2 [Olea europaea var. sylvestris]|uniref:uncharacterized protein LOC111402757 isoform X2 n=1 Tax=Olea europaea var. sylvestris TaxID=158386 RepID=UPI000C1D759A|nr:uncharacterized protein LOC111402757 isoform X2 [Olea europaea var. sylvestris]
MELSILAVCIVLLFVQHLAAEARIHKSKIPQEMHKYSLHELMNSDVSIDISKGESKSPFCVYPPLSHDPPSPSLPPPTTPKSLPSRFRPPPPAYTKPEHAVWCVAKPTIPTSSIQQALDYACASVIGKRLKTVEELATLEALQYLSLLIQVMIDAISSTVDSLFNPYMHKI